MEARHVLNLRPLWEAILREVQLHRDEVRKVFALFPETVDVSGLIEDEPWIRDVDLGEIAERGLLINWYELRDCCRLSLLHSKFEVDVLVNFGEDLLEMRMARLIDIHVHYLEEGRTHRKNPYYPCLGIASKAEFKGWDVYTARYTLETKGLAELTLKYCDTISFSPKALSSAMLFWVMIS